MGSRWRTRSRPGWAHALQVVAVVLIGLSATSVRAQVPAPATPTRDWTFRPVFILGVGYNSNVAYTRTSLVDDYFATIGLRAPLEARLGQDSLLTASYSANAEWYREWSVFDAVPSRQDASLAWAHSPGAWNLSLNATYNESRRPEDVFPEAGVGYLRGTTRNAGAGGTVGRRLGQRTRFETGYSYARPFYQALDLNDRLSSEATIHTARARLERQFSKTAVVGVRYTYQQHLREDLADDTSHVVGLGYRTGLGRHAILDLFAGARMQNGDVRPDWSAALTRAGRFSYLSLGYTRTRNYVPTTEGFTDTDSAHLSWSYERRRFQFSVTGGYARNRLDGESDAALGLDFGSWRASVDTVYMLTRWLGFAAAYQYQWQTSDNPRLGERSRHLAQVGLTIGPWSNRKPQGLR